MEIELDKRIKNAGDLATEAFTYLNKLQQGEKKLLKSGFEFLDVHLDGLLPGDTIIYAGNSGIGKTKLLYDTLDRMLDENINPLAKNYKVLDFSLEMKFLNKILRDASRLTNRKKSEILTTEFTEEQKEIVRRYYEGLKDSRRYVVEETVTTKDFYNMTRDFCLLNQLSDALIVTLDHVLLVNKEDKNEDPFEALTGYINSLRKEFSNVYFILLSQFNRSSYAAGIKDRDNSMVPTTAMIYGSSHFEFLSSYVVAILDPFRNGVQEFMKVNKERYEWLEEFMTDEDKNGKVSFRTLGNSFIFTLKTRESDYPYKNLYIHKKDISLEEIEKLKQSVDKPKLSTPTLLFSETKTEIPVFKAAQDETKLPDTFKPLKFEEINKGDDNSPW
jgi:hypothetical protein